MTNFDWITTNGTEEDKDFIISCLAGNKERKPFAKYNGHLCNCGDERCADCDFFEEDFDQNKCVSKRLDWLKAEYYDIPLDTPEDTKVLVSDDRKNWHRRHLVRVQEKGELKYTCYVNGYTSWTSPEFTHEKTETWKYCKLAESEDM